MSAAIPCASFTWHFFQSIPKKTRGQLLVGLLTDVSRRAFARHRVPVAFPAKPITAASDLLSQKTDMLHNHSYRIARCLSFRLGTGSKTCPGFSPDSLVQRNKDACPVRFLGAGSRICHKSRIIYSIDWVRAQALAAKYAALQPFPLLRITQMSKMSILISGAPARQRFSLASLDRSGNLDAT